MSTPVSRARRRLEGFNTFKLEEKFNKLYQIRFQRAPSLKTRKRK